MKKRPVIKRASISTGMPLLSSMVAWLMLDRFHAPGYVWGIVGTLYAIVWIAFICSFFAEDVRDPFEDWGKK